jgi:hypothetical protein
MLLLYLGTPFTPDSALKCAFIAQGLSTWSRSKLHICLNNTADNGTFYTAGIGDACMTFDYDGNVGIGNLNPLNDATASSGHLCLGDSSVPTSRGALVIAYNNGSGGNRHACMKYDGSFNICLGDYGNANTIASWIRQLVIAYQAPTNSILVNSNGSCYFTYGYSGGSDIILKTDIEPIENALWKVQQLRGVEYTLISENIRCLGVIAQEVEHIIPEVVNINDNGIKGVSYNGLIGLLINAIKEQQQKINNLKNILKNNNIY